MKEEALAILESLVTQFPGLVDGETEVNGADLVEALSLAIHGSDELRSYLKKAS